MTFISKFSYLIVKTLINLFEVVHSFGPFAILSSELKQNLNYVEIKYTTDILTSSSTDSRLAHLFSNMQYYFTPVVWGILKQNWNMFCYREERLWMFCLFFSGVEFVAYEYGYPEKRHSSELEQGVHVHSEAFIERIRIWYHRLPATAFRNSTIQNVLSWLLYSNVFQRKWTRIYSHTAETEGPSLVVSAQGREETLMERNVPFTYE